MLPISGIFLLKPQKATMLGYYGLEVLTKTQQEMFFEFGFKNARDRFVELVQRMKDNIEEKRASMSGECQKYFVLNKYVPKRGTKNMS